VSPSGGDPLGLPAIQGVINPRWGARLNVVCVAGLIAQCAANPREPERGTVPAGTGPSGMT
jgi:hypothetical protein